MSVICEEGEVGSNCARCVQKTWNVSGMEDVVASSRYGSLDRVSVKCSEDPFLYATVKLYRCRKSIIFCRHLGGEARSSWQVDWGGWWSVYMDSNVLFPEEPLVKFVESFENCKAFFFYQGIVLFGRG